MNFWWILYIIDWALFLPVAITVAYILFFAIAATFRTHTTPPKAKGQNRFIILIPAYKSDVRILETVNSILGQTYSQRNFDIVVISSHQSEMINMRLAQLPITLLIPNFVKSTKVKALQYAILNLPQFKIYDAVILLDAGNLVEPEFVEQINDAYEAAGTKAIQAHRIARNRDTAIARLDTIFEEINNAIFRRGHINMGLSSALAGSGTAYDFNWFKANVMKTKTAGEDKELEALLLRQEVFIDYFEDIYIYGEKKRTTTKLNQQRGRWVTQQFQNVIRNVKFLPGAIFRKQYDLADKIIQWMLLPRTTMMGIMILMSIILPFIYMTLVIKWWILTAFVLFIFALVTPDYLIDEVWEHSFLRSPFTRLWKKIRGNKKKTIKK